MPRHCPVTGEVDCECGACDDEPEQDPVPPIPFREPSWPPEGAA